MKERKERKKRKKRERKEGVEYERNKEREREGAKK